MDKRRKIWMGVAVAASLLVGLLLVWNDSGAGWFLILMAAVYLAMLTRSGQTLVASRPTLVRWGLIGTLVLVLLAVVLAGIALAR